MSVPWVGKRLVISIAERGSDEPLGVMRYETDLMPADGSQ
jgi:hypothetical protein